MTILKWYSIILLLAVLGYSIYDGTKEPTKLGVGYVIFTLILIIPVLVYLFIK